MGAELCRALQRAQHSNSYTGAALPQRECGGVAPTQGDDAGRRSNAPERWIGDTVQNYTVIGKVWLNLESGQLEGNRLPRAA